MAAPHIPNLLDTLRSAKASRSRRAAEQPTQTAITKDKIVQQTDDDAAGSRLSAVEAGYLDDPFARPFSNLQGSVRRMPIINRGEQPGVRDPVRHSHGRQAHMCAQRQSTCSWTASSPPTRTSRCR